MITGSQNLKPRLFAEFPAGLAAVSLRLQGGAHCRPPISRCGNKAGFSQTILDALGLRPGQGAADMGATVCVSEQEPIPELMQAGWHATEITADRVGQRRTFSKQQAEWLTMSKPHKRQKTVFDLFSPDSE